MLGCQADLKQETLPVPCPQQVEAQPGVSVQESVTVKGSFSRPFHAHENYRFHTLPPNSYWPDAFRRAKSRLRREIIKF